MTIKPTVHVTDSGGKYFSLCVCDYLLLKILLFAEHVQCEMVCDALNGAVGYESLLAGSLLWSAGSLGHSRAGAGRVPSETIRMVERQEGEQDKRPCRLCLIVFQSQWQHLFSSFTFFLFSFFFAILVPSYCVIAEAVILGHVSPGSAGSEHWTKSSSGGPPESRPSWPTHCKEDERTHSLEPLVLLLMKWTHFVSSKLWLAAPDADVEDWVQADISRSRKVLFILAHLDGVKPLVHWVHTELGGRRLFPAGMQSTFTFYSQCFIGVLFLKKTINLSFV